MSNSYSMQNLHSKHSPSKLSRHSSQPHFSSIFQQTQPSYFFKSNEIPNLSKTIDLERLLQKPNHKITRLKFDKTKTECLQEKENNPLTMYVLEYNSNREDHFKLFDMPWISSLRFVDPSQMSLTKYKINKEGTHPDHAPTFFNDDMDKWKKK